VSSTGNLPDPGQSISPGDNGVFDPNVSHSGSAGFSTGTYVLILFVYPDNVAPQVTAVTPAEQATLNVPPTHSPSRSMSRQPGATGRPDQAAGRPRHAAFRVFHGPTGWTTTRAWWANEMNGNQRRS